MFGFREWEESRDKQNLGLHDRGCQCWQGQDRFKARGNLLNCQRFTIMQERRFRIDEAEKNQKCKGIKDIFTGFWVAEDGRTHGGVVKRCIVFHLAFPLASTSIRVMIRGLYTIRRYDLQCRSGLLG